MWKNGVIHCTKQNEIIKIVKCQECLWLIYRHIHNNPTPTHHTLTYSYIQIIDDKKNTTKSHGSPWEPFLSNQHLVLNCCPLSPNPPPLPNGEAGGQWWVRCWLGDRDLHRARPSAGQSRQRWRAAVFSDNETSMIWKIMFFFRYHAFHRSEGVGEVGLDITYPWQFGLGCPTILCHVNN